MILSGLHMDRLRSKIEVNLQDMRNRRQVWQSQ